MKTEEKNYIDADDRPPPNSLLVDGKTWFTKTVSI